MSFKTSRVEEIHLQKTDKENFSEKDKEGQ